MAKDLVLDVPSDDTPIAACRRPNTFLTIVSHGETSERFTCCARVGGVGFPVDGALNPDFERLAFYLPKDAPLGVQPFEVECPGGGVVAGLKRLEVFERPQLFSYVSEMHTSDEMKLTGAHLQSLHSAHAVPTQGTPGGAFTCIPDSMGAWADEEFDCHFADITPGVFDGGFQRRLLHRHRA